MLIDKFMWWRRLKKKFGISEEQAVAAIDFNNSQNWKTVAPGQAICPDALYGTPGTAEFSIDAQKANLKPEDNPDSRDSND